MQGFYFFNIGHLNLSSKSLTLTLTFTINFLINLVYDTFHLVLYNFSVDHSVSCKYTDYVFMIVYLSFGKFFSILGNRKIETSWESFISVFVSQEPNTWQTITIYSIDEISGVRQWGEWTERSFHSLIAPATSSNFLHFVKTR